MRGHIRKRGNKYAVVLDIGKKADGSRNRKWFSGFNSKKEAQRFLNQKLHEIETGTFVEPSKTKLSEYLEHWLENYAELNCAPRTYEGYEYIIRQHIIPQIGHLTMDKLKAVHIQQYYANRLKVGRKDGSGGLSARSVLHHHRVLHEALEHAVKWQVITVNPSKAVTPPRPPKKKMNVLDKEQIHKLLNAAKGTPLYEGIYIALNTGMRRGEIYGLRWKDVDLDNGRFDINRTVQRVKGKGITFREMTKNGGRRTIDVSESIIKLLKKISARQAQLKLMSEGTYDDENDLVFANPDGSPVDIDGVSRDFGRLIKKIGLPHVRFHDLRHTHASLLIMQNEPPKLISERLGHTSISITMDTYGHLFPSAQKEAAKKLDDYLFGNKYSL